MDFSQLRLIVENRHFTSLRDGAEKQGNGTASYKQRDIGTVVTTQVLRMRQGNDEDANVGQTNQISW